MQLWTDREAHYLPNFFFFKKANNFFLNDRFFSIKLALRATYMKEKKQHDII